MFSFSGSACGLSRHLFTEQLGFVVPQETTTKWLTHALFMTELQMTPLMSSVKLLLLQTPVAISICLALSPNVRSRGEFFGGLQYFCRLQL